MIKKINVKQLQPGMYVHDLNCGWMEHPFVRNRFLVKAEDIERLNEWRLREVYIDTERGLDVPDAPTAEEVRRNVSMRMQAIAKKPPLPRVITRQEEWQRAGNIQREAHRIVHTVLTDVRLGKQIEVEKVQPVVTALTDSIFRNPDALISLSRIKQTDHYTFQHSVAVGTLLLAFCRAQALERPEMELVGMGGLLHDIGKMKVPHHILDKPGKLTDSEFAVMKQHVTFGILILQDIPHISEISLEVAAQHHERYDGSGYPEGLAGQALSRYGQMAAIVDVYDALTSNRVYHRGMEPTEVLRKLLEWSDHHFNPELVQRFIRVVGIYPVGTLVRLESGYLATVVEQHHENLLHPAVRLIYSIATGNFIVPPRDIDLARPGVADRIIDAESPIKWKIDPQRYL